MLEQLVYKNHLNEIINFGEDGIFVDTNELHDYSWNVTQKSSRITALTKGVSTRKLPVKIICKTAELATAAKNKLMEVCEKDCMALKPGKIILGDYYLSCFITKSAKKNYLKNQRYIEVTLTLSTESPFWIREVTQSFLPGNNNAGSGFLDYSFDYDFDYMELDKNEPLKNSAFSKSPFKMVIYGEVANPSVVVAGHEYGVACMVGADEYLTIDSRTKKIFITKPNGETVNHFADRNRDSYIFEPIPPGNSKVIWGGDYGFDITIFEERSEPKWT